jgi:beta,beta-carotene 9',10'-dioxygenase
VAAGGGDQVPGGRPREGELVVDLIAYDDPSIIDALYLDADGPRGQIPRTELRRYVIDLDGGAVSHEKLAEDVELPRIDYGRHNTRDYRYVYCSRSVDGWFDRLVKVDVSDGSEAVWSAPDCHPGEPIFVREPGTDAEDAGVVLSVVLDAAARRSFLLILDARSFEELARAEAPHHIPFGFHGQFVRASG